MINRILFSVMLPVSAATGVNTLLWICLGPVEFSPSHLHLWSKATTALTLFALAGTWLGIVLGVPSWRQRMKWALFSVFGGPFGPWSYWEHSGYVGIARHGLSMIKMLLVGVPVAVLTVWVLSGARAISAALPRSVFASLVVVGVWWTTARTRGKRYLPIWASLVVLIGLLWGLSAMGW